ncbi:hypothetical protein HAX54_044528 [Datura stramonium]|uniref:Uncharacterized protein n=1 Tax=Datura stramonium TaxID=4076 RepID=A0ABS8RPP8_DATST|nr:hypothetical protein [Datura stramonium]
MEMAVLFLTQKVVLFIELTITAKNVANKSISWISHGTENSQFWDIGMAIRWKRRYHAKLGFKIVNKENLLIAEVKQKQSSSEVQFGDDVLSLVVEAHVDHSFVMALVTVYGLIRHML